MSRRAFEPEDPLELRGTGFPEGSLEGMAESLVEEYVMMGFSDQQIWHLFRSPFFAATHALYCARDDAWVREIIDRVRHTWGQPRFTMRRVIDGSG